MRLDLGDWLGVIALALAIPLGIITNMLTPILVGYLEKRKLIKTHRTRQTELTQFRLIADFKAGRRDRYPYYISLGTVSVLFGIASATCILIFSMIKYENRLDELPLFIGLLGIGLALLASGIAASITNVARQIERFDEYKAQIRKKWGDDAV
jgi:MFS family permease